MLTVDDGTAYVGSAAFTTAMTDQNRDAGLIARDQGVVDGIGAVPVLERLDLAQLSSLQELPDLTGATELRTVVIEHCRNLRDLSPLAGAPVLEHVLLIDMPQLTADDVRVLRGHPTLRHAAVGTGSARRNREIAEVLGLPPSPGLVRPQSPLGEV